MEKLVKEKEEATKNIQTSMDVVSLVAVPITRVSTSATTSATSTKKGAKQLTKVVQNLSIQIGEINKLKDELKGLQIMKSISNSSHTN